MLHCVPLRTVAASQLARDSLVGAPCQAICCTVNPAVYLTVLQCTVPHCVFWVRRCIPPNIFPICRVGSALDCWPTLSSTSALGCNRSCKAAIFLQCQLFLTPHHFLSLARLPFLPSSTLLPDMPPCSPEPARVPPSAPPPLAGSRAAACGSPGPRGHGPSCPSASCRQAQAGAANTTARLNLDRQASCCSSYNRPHGPCCCCDCCWQCRGSC